MYSFTEDQITNLQRFHDSLYRNVTEGFIECRFFRDKKGESMFVPVTDRAHLFSSIENHLSNYNCYFGVAIRGSQSNGTKQNCQLITALWADVDYGSVGHKKPSFFATREEALKHVSLIPLQPSAIIDSGHGLHLYWLLDEPLALTTETIKFVEGLMVTIHKVVGGDSTHNVDRILRIPHTYNMKSEPFQESNILSLNAEQRYTLDNIISFVKTDPLMSSPWKKMKQEYYKMLFGIFETKPEDRSAVDQKIITYLNSIGSTNAQIKAIFETFPTTGKYWERKEKYPKGAESYLTLSINKSKEYILNNQQPTANKLVKVLRAGEHETGNAKIFNISNTHIDEADNEEQVNIESNQSEYFSMSENIKSIGYYQLPTDKDQQKHKRLSNFLIVLRRQTKATVDKQPLSKLDGRLKLENGTEINFESMPASFLATPQKFKEYLLNLAGTRVSFCGNTTSLLEAIKHFTKNIEIQEAQEFGYDVGLTQYVTHDYIIDAESIYEKKTPILYSEALGSLRLGFAATPEKSLDEIRKDILHKLLTWDKPSVMYYAFAFTLLPIIYPFLSSELKGKPYLMLQGVTGCGKSTLSLLQFSFYGTAAALTSITSTHTSINIIGHAMKDALFVVDDVKLANVSENDIKRYTALVQNYYDGNSRQRANVNLEVRDPKQIRGFLQFTAEDIILHEPSALARGIIIPMEKKKPDSQKIKELYNLSKTFSYFTLKFIQHLLSVEDKQYFVNILEKNVKFFESLINDSNVSADNLPRLVNNFALVKTAWDIALEFLLTEDERENKSLYEAQFEQASVELFESNINRLQTFKPEEKFEETMWIMVEANIVHFTNINSQYPAHNETEIGIFQIKKDVTIKIGLKFDYAYKLVNEYLRN